MPLLVCDALLRQIGILLSIEGTHREGWIDLGRGTRDESSKYMKLGADNNE